MSSRKPKRKPKVEVKMPAWAECDACGDRFCTYHGVHVFECSCPPLEWWTMKSLWPYEPLTRKQIASVQRKPSSRG